MSKPNSGPGSGKYYRFHHDFESYSRIDLLKCGSDRYAQHPSTEVLMLAWAINDGPVKQWVPMEDGPELPQELQDIIDDPYAMFFAWNKPFEYGIWKHVLGIEIPHKRWRDPMILAYSLSLPGSLAKASEVLGIGEDKKKLATGKQLIRTFSIPRKPTKHKPHRRNFPHHEPEKWEQYKLYNRNDVEAERANWIKMRGYNMPRHEWELWVLDQEINSKGIPINMELVDNAVEIYEETKSMYLDALQIATGLDNPNSPKQLLPWLQEHGYPFNDLKKGHVKRARDRAQEEIDSGQVNNIEERELLIQALDLRLEASQSSASKFQALQRAVDRKENVLRYALQFAGAGRTWRWAGRIFQVQNLPRPVKYLEKYMAALSHDLQHLDSASMELLYDKPMEAIKSGVRPAAHAPEGYTFIDADLNAIENRVLGWLTGCRKILQVFELDQDPYISFSTYLFGGSYEERWSEYKGGDSSKRTISKPGVLGCGYMLSKGDIKIDHKTGEEEATGLLGYAWNMGIREFTQEQSALSVDTFRREFKEVKDYWYDIERAAKKAIKTGKPVDFGVLRFDLKGPFLRMRLPSGRHLHYCRPRIEQVMAPWGKMKDSITYEGIVKGQWKRQSTHPGKLTENADQAISRDLLAHGMLLARDEGIDIRMHVHDQILGLVKEDDAEEALKCLIACMGVTPDWAKGLPLKADGFISPFFTKD